MFWNADTRCGGGEFVAECTAVLAVPPGRRATG